MDDFWVFGYGSLIWNPGFAVAERGIALASGWHRSFCMRSIHHRGTVADPGLVLALDKAADAQCQGVAFRVEPGEEAATLDTLRARELISSAYLETTLQVQLADGREVAALAYVIEPEHEQYCGGLPLEKQAQIIVQAVGERGRNCDYLFATSTHLIDLGIADQDLTWLTHRVRALQG